METQKRVRDGNINQVQGLTRHLASLEIGDDQADLKETIAKVVQRLDNVDWKLVTTSRLPWSVQYLNSTVNRLERSLKRGIVNPREKNPYNAAICLYGSFRVNSLIVPAFKRFVLKHLGFPDLFLFVSPLNDPYMIPYQAELRSLAKEAVEDEDYDYNTVKARGGYAPCLDQHNENINWNGGWPTSFFPNASMLHQLRGAQECGKIIRKHEEARGKKYDWVILSRTDHYYLRPHPALRKMMPSLAYVPYGEDWGGINDRHAVLPRKDAEKRFGFHEQLMTNKYDCAFAYRTWLVNIESLMLDFYQRNQVNFGRYLTPQYLGCCEAKHRAHHRLDSLWQCERYSAEFDVAWVSLRKFKLFAALDELVEQVHLLEMQTNSTTLEREDAAWDRRGFDEFMLKPP